jgi:predicted O-linked N-acetylglucosamine transferase (SPINDLY family)
LNLGNVLREQRRPNEAIASLRAALAIQPRYPAALNSLGVALHEQGDFDEAIRCFREASRLQPGYPKPLVNLGNLLVDLDRLDEAQAAYRQALARKPDYVEALLGQAAALEKQRRSAEAAAILRRVLRAEPDHPAALFNLGNLHYEQHDYSRAADAYRRALAHRPDFPEALANAARSMAEICDWTDRRETFERLRQVTVDRLKQGTTSPVPPSSVHAFPFTPDEKLAIAVAWAEAFAEKTRRRYPDVRFSHAPHGRERLRVGYLSCDLRNHAIGHLTRSLFALHDRDRFEVFAYSWGPDDGSVYRESIVAGCDRFVEIAALTDAESARRIDADEIDLLVDLMGHSGNARPAILALRPAPVQIGYLGFPGTSGAAFIDYFVTDRVLTPPGHEAHFRESLIVMPHSYQVNDHDPPTAPREYRRSEFGLPEEGFVFCGFNKSFKIEPQIFDAWSRVLEQVRGSVLWLTESSARSKDNLLREAATRGLAPDRLVFASTLPKPEHLARHRLADLFLDTLVCNAHTTASDALWAGVPVLTCPGDDFARRVGASLVSAVGMPELIAPDLREYERLAVEVARDPDRLRGLRHKLAVHRAEFPLFDTARFVRNLERGYRKVWEVYCAGSAPRTIVVDDTAPARNP